MLVVISESGKNLVNTVTVVFTFVKAMGFDSSNEKALDAVPSNEWLNNLLHWNRDEIERHEPHGDIDNPHFRTPNRRPVTFHGFFTLPFTKKIEGIFFRVSSQEGSLIMSKSY